jgi:hypothetical protein
MDEARRVIERLEQIERLEEAQAALDGCRAGLELENEAVTPFTKEVIARSAS